MKKSFPMKDIKQKTITRTLLINSIFNNMGTQSQEVCMPNYPVFSFQFPIQSKGRNLGWFHHCLDPSAANICSAVQHVNLLSTIMKVKIPWRGPFRISRVFKIHVDSTMYAEQLSILYSSAEGFFPFSSKLTCGAILDHLPYLGCLLLLLLFILICLSFLLGFRLFRLPCIPFLVLHLLLYCVYFTLVLSRLFRCLCFFCLCLQSLLPLYCFQFSSVHIPKLCRHLILIDRALSLDFQLFLKFLFPLPLLFRFPGLSFLLPLGQFFVVEVYL